MDSGLRRGDVPLARLVVFCYKLRVIHPHDTTYQNIFCGFVDRAAARQLADAAGSDPAHERRDRDVHRTRGLFGHF